MKAEQSYTATTTIRLYIISINDVRQTKIEIYYIYVYILLDIDTDIDR